MNSYTYKYFHKKGSTTVYIVLHGGGSKGIESAFMRGVFDALANKSSSVFAFNFPYCERNEVQSSGPELLEEIQALNEVVLMLKKEGYKKLIIVAKSLGAITASYWWPKGTSQNCELVVLGYPLGEVKTNSIKDSLILVIQGEFDKFGNAKAVKQEFTNNNVVADVIEIPKADHSYRNANNETTFQDEVFKILASQFN